VPAAPVEQPSGALPVDAARLLEEEGDTGVAALVAQVG
jgi:hypothetical protein